MNEGCVPFACFEHLLPLSKQPRSSEITPLSLSLSLSSDVGAFRVAKHRLS